MYEDEDIKILLRMIWKNLCLWDLRMIEGININGI